MNIVLIGLGRILSRHMNAIQELGLTISNVFDVDFSKIEYFFNTYNNNNVLFLDINSLSSDKSDIASVISSSGDHYSISKALIDKNYHVVIEKPVALSLREIDE